MKRKIRIAAQKLGGLNHLGSGNAQIGNWQVQGMGDGYKGPTYPPGDELDDFVVSFKNTIKLHFKQSDDQSIDQIVVSGRADNSPDQETRLVREETARRIFEYLKSNILSEELGWQPELPFRFEDWPD